MLATNVQFKPVYWQNGGKKLPPPPKKIITEKKICTENQELASWCISSSFVPHVASILQVLQVPVIVNFPGKPLYTSHMAASTGRGTRGGRGGGI